MKKKLIELQQIKQELEAETGTTRGSAKAMLHAALQRSRLLGKSLEDCEEQNASLQIENAARQEHIKELEAQLKAQVRQMKAIQKENHERIRALQIANGHLVGEVLES